MATFQHFLLMEIPDILVRYLVAEEDLVEQMEEATEDQVGLLLAVFMGWVVLAVLEEDL